MKTRDPWYKKPLFIGLLILLFAILIAGLRDSEIKAQQASAETAPTTFMMEQPSDSAQQDALGTSSVNGERLRQRINANSNAPVDTTNLDSQINNIINSNSDIVFGVSIIDLNTGSAHNYGNLEPMTAASVTKVLTATDYYKEVELGHKSLSTVMVDGNTAEYDIEQMIVVSDNNAWHVLNDALTYPQMQAYAESIGLTSYNYADNTISSSDTAKLLAGVYMRRLINEAHTESLLSYMERANYRDLVLPAVPEHDTAYHKAGELYGNLNDAVIITNSTESIVLSIYTHSYYYDKARVSALMQEITTPTLTTFSLN
jgi:beta-lactamase class A